MIDRFLLVFQVIPAWTTFAAAGVAVCSTMVVYDVVRKAVSWVT